MRPLASDRPQIAERFARHDAEQVEPVALRLLGGVLVREDVGAGRAELEGADHAGGVPLHAVLVGGGHAVEGEARPLVDHEGAVGEPRVELLAGDVVAGVAVGLVGQVDAHGVVRVAAASSARCAASITS